MKKYFLSPLQVHEKHHLAKAEKWQDFDGVQNLLQRFQIGEQVKRLNFRI
ncbi:hypothetical protein [Olivibacter sp. XZL3]|nr:hypothetical protein [Olivibacter sp. XZL3]